jgi:hypothetical protein
MNKQKTPLIVWLLSGLTVLILILVLALPFKKSKDIAYDEKTSDDLQSLSAKIDSYYTKNRRLPSELKDLELEDDLKSRAEKRNYQYKKGASADDSQVDIYDTYGGSSSRSNTRSFDRLASNNYSLCATFKTDQSKEKPSYANNSVSDNYYDLRYHKSGEQCFDYTTDSYNYDPYDYNYQSSDPEDLKNDFLYNLQ